MCGMHRHLHQVTKWLVAEEVEAAANSGAYVYGLCLEGAAWAHDAMSVMEQVPGQLQAPIPVLLLEPRLVEHLDLSARTYEAPMCKTSTRHGATVGGCCCWVVAVVVAVLKKAVCWGGTWLHAMVLCN
jgi:hypothetical protein